MHVLVDEQLRTETNQILTQYRLYIINNASTTLKTQQLGI